MEDKFIEVHWVDKPHVCMGCYTALESHHRIRTAAFVWILCKGCLEDLQHEIVLNARSTPIREVKNVSTLV
jgi:hypothetical protein